MSLCGKRRHRIDAGNSQFAAFKVALLCEISIARRNFTLLGKACRSQQAQQFAQLTMQIPTKPFMLLSWVRNDWPA
jgi:hypothetical protein